MKITPLEIRQKDFEKKLRGYDKDEVNAFLSSLSHEWERSLEEKKELQSKLRNAEQDVQRLRDVETSLFKTLKTAEDTGANILEQATKTAELQLRDSQIQFDGILNDAKQQAKDIIDSAELKARNALEDAKNEIRQLHSEYKTIEGQRESLLLELRSITTETLERVEKMRKRKLNFPLINLDPTQDHESSNTADKYEFKKIEPSPATIVRKEEKPQPKPTPPQEEKITSSHYEHSPLEDVIDTIEEGDVASPNPPEKNTIEWNMDKNDTRTQKDDTEGDSFFDTL